jgi:hypothetical protein
VSKIFKKYFTCADCRLKAICSTGKRGKRRNKCVEFELDMIQSDTYVNELIARNKNEFINQWNELILENTHA